MLEFLNELRPCGQTQLEPFCREFALKYRRRGIVALLSDLLDPAGFEGALKHLTHGGNDVYVLHTLADEELEPAVAGHLDLVDVETEDHTEITASPQMLALYRRTVNAFCGQIKQFCGRYGMTYMLTASSTDFEQLILAVLRGKGLVN